MAHLRAVQSDTGGTGAGAVSRTAFPGVSPAHQAPFDPHAFRRVFPERWAAFLRAHHRDPVEVAYIYGVTERAARDWWDGVTGPRGSVVAQAQAQRPEAFAAIFWPVAA